VAPVVDALLATLDAARNDLLDALADVDEDLVTAPGVVGDWSVRDLVVHVAAWAEHAAGAIDLATSGRGAEFAYSPTETDAMNERILADARTTSPAAALAREATAFAQLRDRVAALDPSVLSTRLGNGDSVDEVIGYDGADHYAEHTAHLRAWFGDDESADDESADDESADDESADDESADDESADDE
jgi:Mycothiol maleylpyruvate isomerase N-terminal domain